MELIQLFWFGLVLCQGGVALVSFFGIALVFYLVVALVLIVLDTTIAMSCYL